MRKYIIFALVFILIFAALFLMFKTILKEKEKTQDLEQRLKYTVEIINLSHQYSNYAKLFHPQSYKNCDPFYIILIDSLISSANLKITRESVLNVIAVVSGFNEDYEITIDKKGLKIGGLMGYVYSGGKLPLDVQLVRGMAKLDSLKNICNGNENLALMIYLNEIHKLTSGVPKQK